MLCITRGLSTKCWINKEYRCLGEKNKLKSRFYSSFKNKSCLSSFPLPLRTDREGQPAVLAPEPLSQPPLPEGAGPEERNAAGRRRDTPGSSLLSSPRYSSPFRALPQAERPRIRRRRWDARVSRRPRAPGGEQRQVSSRERVRCAFEWDTPLLASPQPLGPVPAPAPLPASSRCGDATSATRSPHRRRGGGGQEQPPIRSCGRSLTDKPHRPIGVVT